MGDDSSGKGAKIQFSGYYKCQKSLRKCFFIFLWGLACSDEGYSPLVLPGTTNGANKVEFNTENDYYHFINHCYHLLTIIATLKNIAAILLIISAILSNNINILLAFYPFTNYKGGTNSIKNISETFPKLFKSQTTKPMKHILVCTLKPHKNVKHYSQCYTS